MALEILYSEVSKDFRVTEDGRLFRLSNQWGREKEVEIKSNHGDGYCGVGWKNKIYLSHRIMYSLYYQVDVDVNLKIDHKDGNRANNLKDNLHLVTNRGNSQNKECHRGGKLLGCRLHKCGKWQARILINDRDISLGLYEAELEAHNAYNTALTMLDKTVEEIKEFFGIKTKDKCTSKFVGVSFHKQTGKWQAETCINGKRKYLGLFQTEEQAHQAICKYRN